MARINRYGSKGQADMKADHSRYFFLEDRPKNYGIQKINHVGESP